MEIKGFNGPHQWLSNFALCEVEINDMIFPSVENAYQAGKFISAGDFATANKLISCTAGKSKRIGKTAVLVSNWSEIKIYLMEDLISQKFNQRPFKELLLSTGECFIEETNWWNDTYWGVCNGKGENTLGKLIMEKRAKLRNPD